MSDVECGDAARLLKGADQRAHLLTQLGVEVGQRLVEQQQQARRITSARPQRHTLLLTATQRARQPLAQTRQPDHVERLGDPRGSLDLCDPAGAQPVAQILAHRHVRKQRVVLKHHAKITRPRRHVTQTGAIDENVATVCVEEACNAAQRRRLAAAARPPQQRHQFAACRLERHTVQRDALAVRFS